MRKQKQRRFILLCIAIAIVIAVAFPITHIVLAADLPDTGDDCAPFDENGNARPQSQCLCSQDPDEVSYCMDATEYLVHVGVTSVKVGALGALKYLAEIWWLVARVCTNIAEKIIDGGIWNLIKETLWDMFDEGQLGGSTGILSTIVRGNSGLFYWALMLGGLLMTMPMLGSNNLVRPDKAIIWFVVLTALFIGGTRGFDLISAIEDGRSEMMDTVSGIGGGPDDVTLVSMVTLPMEATLEEARAIDLTDPLVLPEDFEKHFFQDANDNLRRIRIRGGVRGQQLLEVVWAAEIVRDGEFGDALALKQKYAGQGLFRVAVSVYTTYVLVLFAVFHAILTVSALILILFFVVSLPLGFFEFGSSILMNLVKKYIGVFAWSLFGAAITRFLYAVMGGLVTEGFTSENVVPFLATSIIVMLILSLSIKQVTKVLDGTMDTVKTSVAAVAAVGPAPSGKGPLSQAEQAAGKALNTATTAALAAGAGAVTGGLGVGVAAGAGGLLRGSSKARDLAGLAGTIAPESRHVEAFGTGMRTGLRGMIVSGRRWRHEDGKDHTKPGKSKNMMAIAGAGAGQGGAPKISSRAGSTAETSYQPAQVDPHWGTVDTGDFITPDMTNLQDAETAFGEGNTRKARGALQKTFGDRALANDAMDIYGAGKEGAPWVRAIVETAQGTAIEMQGDGKRVVNPDGTASPEYLSSVRTQLAEEGLIDPSNPSDVGFVNRAATAVARRATPLQDDPGFAAKLARDTMSPPAVETRVNDVAAQNGLRSLAVSLDLDESHLQAIFSAVQEGRKSGAKSGQGLEDIVSQTTMNSPAFKGTNYGQADYDEMARLGVLVSSGEVQQPASMPKEEEKKAPAAATQDAAPGGASDLDFFRSWDDEPPLSDAAPEQPAGHSEQPVQSSAQSTTASPREESSQDGPTDLPTQSPEAVAGGAPPNDDDLLDKALSHKEQAFEDGDQALPAAVPAETASVDMQPLQEAVQEMTEQINDAAYTSLLEDTIGHEYDSNGRDSAVETYGESAVTELERIRGGAPVYEAPEQPPQTPAGDDMPTPSAVATAPDAPQSAEAGAASAPAGPKKKKPAERPQKRGSK